VPNRYILHLAVALAVASAVVLHLDDNAAKLAVRKVQYVFDNWRVVAASAYIGNQNSEPAAHLQRIIAPPQTNHQQFSKPIVALAAAQVTCTTSVLHDVPVRRVYPHKVKLARQVVLGQIKATAKVTAPVAYPCAFVLVEASDNIPAIRQ